MKKLNIALFWKSIKCMKICIPCNLIDTFNEIKSKSKEESL